MMSILMLGGVHYFDIPLLCFDVVAAPRKHYSDGCGRGIGTLIRVFVDLEPEAETLPWHR